MQWLSGAVGAACQFFVTESVQLTGPLTVVAAYAGCSLILYGLTRGREFLAAGYASVLFLVPFVHLS